MSVSDTYIVLGVVSFVIVVIIFGIIYDYYNNPFSIPQITHDIDITGRKKPNYYEWIDDWMLHQYNHRDDILKEFNSALRNWDSACKQRIDCALLWKSHKEELYYETRKRVINENYKMFVFRFYRIHTRYQQRNYQRYSYQVKDVDKIVGLSLRELLGVDYKLEEIGYETTLRKYEVKKQRDAMTQSLRKKIMERDYYTCRYCGKYMPSGKGIHIDHIVPVAKGGLTIESNLQVLCARCNLRKGCK